MRPRRESRITAWSLAAEATSTTGDNPSIPCRNSTRQGRLHAPARSRSFGSSAIRSHKGARAVTRRRRVISSGERLRNSSGFTGIPFRRIHVRMDATRHKSSRSTRTIPAESTSQRSIWRGVGEGDGRGVGEEEGAGEAVGAGVAVALGAGVAVRLGAGEMEGLGAGVGDGEGRGKAVGEGAGERAGTGDGLGVEIRLGDGLGARVVAAAAAAIPEELAGVAGEAPGADLEGGAEEIAA